MTNTPKPAADDKERGGKSDLPSRKLDDTSADDEIDEMIRRNIAREGP